MKCSGRNFCAVTSTTLEAPGRRTGAATAGDETPLPSYATGDAKKPLAKRQEKGSLLAGDVPCDRPRVSNRSPKIAWNDWHWADSLLKEMAIGIVFTKI
jgi:hypothetical protein